MKLGDYQEALQIRRKTISIQERALPANHPGIAASYHEMVSTFYFLSRLDSALVYEHKAYDILKAQLLTNDAQLAVPRIFLCLPVCHQRRTAAGTPLTCTRRRSKTCAKPWSSAPTARRRNGGSARWKRSRAAGKRIRPSSGNQPQRNCRRWGFQSGLS
ncbi:MAG: tetratricopeptide repeat protein [Lewinellaceae bacterium]|nr:tetratricopeptide repeat protein [Lewinellaceae bacterium]